MPDAQLHEARRMRRRVSRLNATIASAMAGEPEAPTIEQFMGYPGSLPSPDVAPQVTTTGGLRRALGPYVNSAYVNHPVDSHGCRTNHHGPYRFPAV